MKSIFPRICVALLITLAFHDPALSAVPANDETTTATQWMHDVLLADKGSKPFSFLFDGKPSGQLLNSSKLETTQGAIDAQTRQHTLTWTTPRGLQVRCVITEYSDLPAVEWVLWFKNTGTHDTPILENVLPLDMPVQAPDQTGPFTLHYALGSHQAEDDFAPRQYNFDAPDKQLALNSYGGRSSDSFLPFFNLTKPQHDGVIFGIGWSGQWSAFLKRDATGVRVQAGLEKFRARLHPGEEIRTPAALAIFWHGADWMHGQNLLRSVLLNHYTPMAEGKRAQPPLAFAPHMQWPFERTTEQNMIEGIKAVAAARLPVDTWWIDTGWMTLATTNKEWQAAIGNPDPDPSRYPRGLRPVSDAAHANGMKFLLWFEPQRVMPTTWLYRTHPEWLIAPPANVPPQRAYLFKDGFHLLNLANPDALAWLKKKIGGQIGEMGIDIYREDFNLYPLDYYHANEQPDRVGIMETKLITAHYDYWDYLRRRYPKLIIDNCASGGRRIDFETLRRSMPLWRSDYVWFWEAMQAHQYALSQWIPIHGGACNSANPYKFRSGMGSSFTLNLRYLTDHKGMAAAKSLLEQYNSIRHLYDGDFYPLTPCSARKNTWIAWQYQRTDLKEGLIQAFRRPEATEDKLVVKLQALDAAKKYEVENLDGGKTVLSGEELMGGYKITLQTNPAAAVFRVRERKE